MGSRTRGRPEGPAVPPCPPRLGALAGLAAAARLPVDLLAALGYVVREVPFLVQDLRSLVNDLALLAHAGDPGALGELLNGLARAAGRDGELSELLRSAADLARAKAEQEASS